jgi:hypothetical protein
MAPERRRHPNRSFGFSPEIGRSWRKGIDLDVSFNKEIGAGSVIDVVTATVGQEFPPVQSPSSGRIHQPTDQDPWPGS